MEATEKRGSLQMRRLLGTRSGTLALAAGVAAMAGLVLIVFLGQYKDSVRGGTVPVTALVAGSLIPKGTSGDTVIGERLFRTTTLPQDQVKGGAIPDTGTVAGKVAVRDIYPGQQLTAADFASKADAVRGKLTGDQRGIAIPIDASHGLVGEVRAGDHVDVLAGFNAVNTRNGTGHPFVRTLMQNVLVLSVPKEADSGVGASATSSVMLRVSDRQAAAIAFAADNGKVWFTLRAPAGSSEHPAAAVDLESLLAGVPAVSTGDGR